MKKMKQSTFNLLMAAVWGLNLVGSIANLVKHGPEWMNVVLIICSGIICVFSVPTYFSNRKKEREE